MVKTKDKVNDICQQKTDNSVRPIQLLPSSSKQTLLMKPLCPSISLRSCKERYITFRKHKGSITMALNYNPFGTRPHISHIGSWILISLSDLLWTANEMISIPLWSIQKHLNTRLIERNLRLGRALHVTSFSFLSVNHSWTICCVTVDGNVGAACKVFPQWSQKTMRHQG